MSSIMVIANTTSFSSLYHPHIRVLEGLSWWMGMAVNKVLLLFGALGVAIVGVWHDVVVDCAFHL